MTQDGVFISRQLHVAVFRGVDNARVPAAAFNLAEDIATQSVLAPSRNGAALVAGGFVYDA